MRKAKPIFFLALVAAAAPAFATDDSVTYVGPGQRGWFICDTLDSGVVLLVRQDAAAKRATIHTLRKAVPAIPAVSGYALGRADPGAGQVYYALSANGREVGNIHAFNPGIYDDSAVRTPPITSVKIGTAAHQCRWLANTRMIGIAARRSFVVRETAPGRLVYESFDYARPAGPILNPDGVQRTTRPTQSVRGGQEAGGHNGGATVFRFANRGYAYVITAAQGAATLAVFKGGRVLQRDRLIGYTLSPRR